MLRSLVAIPVLGLAFLLLVPSSSQAAVIGTGGFTSPVLINFNTAPGGLIGGFYSGLGVTFAHLSGGGAFDTGTGAGVSPVALNFGEPGFPAGEALFSSAVTRAGFFISTNAGDNTTVSAYLGGNFVGSELFVTGGAGFGGSFAGVEFLGGFDRLVIDPQNNATGAFLIDDFRFEAAPVPEPATLTLLLTGAIGLAGYRRRR